MLGYMAAFFDNVATTGLNRVMNSLGIINRRQAAGLGQTTSSATGSTLTTSNIQDYIANTQATYYSPAYASDFGLGQMTTTATETQMRRQASMPRFDQMTREYRRQAGQTEEMNIPAEVWALMQDPVTLRTDERNGNYHLSQHGQILWRYIGRDNRWVREEDEVKHMDADWSPADKAYTIALFMAENGWFKWNRGPMEFARLVNQLHEEYADVG